MFRVSEHDFDLVPASQLPDYLAAVVGVTKLSGNRGRVESELIGDGFQGEIKLVFTWCETVVDIRDN